MYHCPGNQWCAATATAAATTQGRMSDLPFHIPEMRARKTAVNAKSRPQRAGSSTAPPKAPPTNVDPVQAQNIKSPPPSRNAASRRPFVNSPMVSAQFSSAMKNTDPYALRGDNFENTGPRAAPISTCLMPTTSVVTAMATTGSGDAQSPSTTNWAAPEKTSALIKAASPAPSPACPASVPNTRPMALPLIAIGTHLLAPASAPERVNFTAPSVPLGAASRTGISAITGVRGTARGVRRTWREPYANRSWVL